MDRSEVRSKIAHILADVLDQDHLVLTDETTADEVDDWDSTNHVRLIIAIESEFGIRFESSEIASPNNVGELVDLVQSKL